MDLKMLVVFLVVVASAYARLHQTPPPEFDGRLINRPPPPKFDYYPRGRVVRSAPEAEPMHERMRRSPQDGKHGSVVVSGSRTEGRGGAPAQQSVRGDYNHNLWRGKNGATVDANAYYQRNWGAGPRQDYGGGIRASIPFGRR
uniref:Lugensin B n=1 Tax=Nilaparvata lugens TaxID=108931 RepID=A0A5K1KAX8_NILLU|nr:lugensin B [Nilaparvata lugens]